MRGIALVTILMLITTTVVMADSATMNLSVGNSVPTGDNIVVDGQDTSASVNPNAGSTTSVSIEFEVSDDNGYQDINYVSCMVWNPSGNPDFVTMSFNGSVDSNTAIYTGSFNLDFFDESGSYDANCTVQDSSFTTGNLVEEFDYEALTALGLDASSISFSAVTPGQTSSLNGDEDMGTASAPTIQNMGNVQIDAEISGTDLVNGGDTISVDNVEYQFGSLGYNTMSTSTQQELGLNLAAGSSSLENVDFRVYVPVGTESTSYSSTVTITAIAD